MYFHMFTWTLIFFRNLFMICVFCYWLKIFLVIFSKCKLCSKPFEAYQNLMFSDVFTYIFLVLMHVLQRIYYTVLI